MPEETKDHEWGSPKLVQAPPRGATSNRSARAELTDATNLFEAETNFQRVNDSTREGEIPP